MWITKCKYVLNLYIIQDERGSNVFLVRNYSLINEIKVTISYATVVATASNQ